MFQLPMINSPLGRGGNAFPKKKRSKTFYGLYQRVSESKSNCFPKRYLKIDAGTVVLVAFSTEIPLRFFPFSLTLTDICPSVGYPMRKSPLLQGVKDCQKMRVKIFTSIWEKIRKKNQSILL